jgi:hemolysin III
MSNDSLSHKQSRRGHQPTREVMIATKPLLRGWFHAAAAIASMALTIVLCLLARNDSLRFFAMLVFGLSMVELYTVSATYHIGTGFWSAATANRLRALDHANIFVLIAGTYTPLCIALLSGWLKLAILVLIWGLALVGIGLATVTLRAPRSLTAGLYVGMGWVAILALPAFLRALPLPGVILLLLGGILYTTGAVIYARKRPDPFPRVLGFHEIFHLCVIAGSISFAVVIAVWATTPHGAA